MNRQNPRPETWKEEGQAMGRVSKEEAAER